MPSNRIESAPRYYLPLNKIKRGTRDVIIIGDYGDPIAPNEVISHFHGNDDRNLLMQPRFAEVPKFNTLATAMAIAQFGLRSQHKDMIIFSNTAPRGENHDPVTGEKIIPWSGNDDQPFVLALLPNDLPPHKDIPVFFVNSGFAGSVIKERARGFWRVNVPNKGTQFRSRDIYPKAVTDYIYGKSVIGTEIDPATIPNPPKGRVGIIDGYDNIKTTDRETDWPKELKDEDTILVTINGITRENVYNRVSREGDYREGEVYVQAGSWGGKKIHSSKLSI